MTEGAIVSRKVDVAHLPPGDIEIVASDRERAALVAEYGLVAVNAWLATVTLTPGPRGSVAVDGRVVADVVQTCVVSLVPVDQHIDETFSVRFVRAGDAPPPLKPGAEVVVDPDAPDPPAILDGPTVDVGAIAEETFALAIDPYPRAPGATLPVEIAEPNPLADSPFAILADLAKPPTDKS